MNKLFQTALMAALLITPGLAGENQPITGKVTFEKGTSVDSGTTLSLADGAEAILAKGTTIEVMGTLEGPATGTATIKCVDGNATVDINTLQLTEMEESEVTTLTNKGLGYTSEDMTYYHMKSISEAGKIENRDNITFTNVDVTENSLLGEVQGINDSDKTLVLGSDSEPAQNMTLKNPNGEAVEVKVNLANEGYDAPYPLTITGSFNVQGDNAHFTEGTVTFDGSETTFSGDNSAFQSEMQITNHSVVTFNKPVTLSKDIAVSNSEIVFKEPVKLTSGVKLVIGAALTPVLTYVINFPGEYDLTNHYLYNKLGSNIYYRVTIGESSGTTLIIVKVESNEEISNIDSIEGNIVKFYVRLYNDNMRTNAGISLDPEKLSIDYTSLSGMVNDKRDDQVNVGNYSSYPSSITYGELYDLLTNIETDNMVLKHQSHLHQTC